MARNMKVSLVATVKNEEKSIRDLLDSMIAQTRKADEIIIVDGGSKDRTVEIIESYIEGRVPIKLITKDEATIGLGRNVAIRNANYGIIASTDAGCILDKNWLKNLLSKFDNGVDVVSGVYKPLSKTLFEECVGEMICPKIERLTDDFLPSSRSVAFRKEAWETVGGYPENLKFAEDTLFDLKLRNAGFKFKVAKDAVVYWRIRSSLEGLFKQFYNYAKWDAIAERMPAVYKTAVFDLAALIALVLVFCFVSKISAIILSPFILREYLAIVYRERKIAKAVYKVLIKLTLNLSTAFGFIDGFFRRITR